METRYEESNKVTKQAIAWNILLTIIKIVAGVLGKSSAMIADGLHSASDIISSVGVLLGNYISATPVDKEHNYGHEKAETLVSFLLSILLIVVSGSIGIKAVKSLGNIGEIAIPTVLPLVVAIISILIKEYQYRITIKIAKKINSPALKADAWHHRSDALSSIGALIGIIGARMGYPVLDPLASVLICAFILKAAIDIFMDAVNKMVDKACDDSVVDALQKCIYSQNGVLGISSLQTRMFGSKIYVDVEIEADGKQTLIEAHDIAQKVHDAIEKEFVLVKHCMVHVNPYKGKTSEAEVSEKEK